MSTVTTTYTGNTFSEIIESTTNPITNPTYRIQETQLSSPYASRTSIDTYPTQRDAVRAQMRHEVVWGEWE